ncbi:MAG: SAM-dependent DNA methyltransferase [Deltaproteobacteria bacterium]|nr:SAM-dependent DNA methyltransferase [Deltaproteobacteria bacterium]
MNLRLPNWLKSRVESLWEAFGERSFRFSDAVRILAEKHQDPPNQVNVILSELRKRGRLKVELDPHDARERIYQLISPKAVIQELFQPELGRGELESLLKRAADLIRTQVDYTFILVLLFYKRICDKWRLEYEEAYEQALADGFSEEEAQIEARASAYHDFDIPEEFLWDNLRKDPGNLPQNLSRAFKALAEGNPELRAVFENVDFLQFAQSYENAEILRQLFELFSSYSLDKVSPDILGDAYEWILRYFAPQKAKEGEVYTPREVIQLMVEMLAPKPGESVYDPACGSGGMLISAYKHVESKRGREEADKLFLFGQELNFKTIALAKMNLYIHDIRNAQLFQGNTLLYPKFKEGGKLKQFDIVITNPPWNQDGYDEDTVKKGEFVRERFPYGFATRQSADWLWIQHLIASAKENGRIAVVIDNGALFRGGREKKIRKGILEADLIEAVLLLPEKLFYNTGAPGAILVLRKGKPKERENKVLFINASQDYEPHPEVRKLNRLGDQHIGKIAKAYHEFREIEGFSRVVPLEEIRENDYNLNVSLYVFPAEEEEQIDVAAEWQELQALNRELQKVEGQIQGYLEELGYLGQIP